MDKFSLIHYHRFSWLNQVCLFLKVLFLLFVAVSCDSEREVQKQGLDKYIIDFKVADYKVTVASNEIIITVPDGEDVTQLVPLIIIPDNATISPESGVAQDFSTPVIYTVVTHDGTVQSYTARVQFEYGLLEFNLVADDHRYTADIDYEKREITVVLNFEEVRGRDVKSEAKLLSGYSLVPEPGALINIDTPADQSVYNKKINTYAMYKLIIRSNGNAIRWFKLQLGNEDDYMLTATPFRRAFPQDIQGLPEESFVLSVLSTDDVSSIIPVIQVSERTTVDPDPSIPRDFNQDVIYNITSETGEVKSYTIRLLKKSFIVSREDDANNLTGQPTSLPSLVISYRSVSNVISGKLVNTKTSEDVECAVSTSVGHTYEGKIIHYLKFDPIGAWPPGQYNISVVLENGEEVLSKARFEIYEE